MATSQGTASLEELGVRLRSERMAQGRTLADLAREVGVTKGYLSRVERGKAKPARRTISRIADALRVDATPFHILAGHLPVDIAEILYTHPAEAPTVLRERFAEYGVRPRTGRPSQQRAVPFAVPTGREAGCKSLYQLVEADCFEWLGQRAPNTIHAVVTDPPYGLREYTPQEKMKLRRGRGGVWRIPPTLDGYTRRPLPRFTVLSKADRRSLAEFLGEWARRIIRVLVPGGHVFIATNPLVSHIVYRALEEAGFEKRGEIIRLVQTLRGGDRPKNAHQEFDMVTVMPRSCWEPWGLFRKPCEGRVQDNLRKWQTGGLHRESAERPFSDVIRSAPARGTEREIAPHPSLKPQAFMRRIVHAALPLGTGVILDPFMGSGATIAAACALQYRSIGIECDAEFFRMAKEAIPRLSSLVLNDNGNGIGLSTRAARSSEQPDLFG